MTSTTTIGDKICVTCKVRQSLDSFGKSGKNWLTRCLDCTRKAEHAISVKRGDFTTRHVRTCICGHKNCTKH